MEEVYKWLADISERHPPFDVSTWVPLSVRYRHLPIKTLWRTDMEEILKMPTADELEVECPMCYGEGRFEVVGGEANWDLMDPVNWSTCSECNGEGKILRKGV